MKMHLSLTVAWFVLAFLSLSKVAQQFSELQFEQGGYEVLQYGNFKEFLDHKLNISQVLASFLVKDYTDCAFKCLANVGCLSFNFAIKLDIGTDLHSCHLLASDRFNHSTRLVPSDEFHHYTFWSLCENSPCQNGGSCRPLYENKSFVCDCLGIYYGPLCKNLKVLPSCQEIYQANRKFKSGVYELRLGSQEVPVYCQMGIDECGSGGWTTVMKIDGRKSNLGYNSQYWSNKESFNPQGGTTGFDESETKLPSYWSTPFSKICLGMKVGDGTPKFILMNKTSDSLYSLIADDKYRPTTLGRDTWKKLIETSSLQQHCNREGFNSICITAKARIGIHANQENDCNSCDSRIAFGGAGHPDDSNKCGNVATHNGAGDRNIKAMGYILVQ